MAYYNDRPFRRQPETRRYPGGGGYGRGFGWPRRRHGRGYGTVYGGRRRGAYGLEEYGGRGPVRPRERAWRPAEYEWGSRYARGGSTARSRRGFGGYGAAFERFGYGTQFGGPAPLDLEGGRAYGRPEEPRYGYTPSSRWPEDGHDVDHLTARERAVSDDDVRNIVHENLSRDHWLDTREIDVDVDHGVVTLRGDVNDYMEARYAWDDAWESQGVRGVINNLTVRTDQPSPEMDLPQTSGRTRGGTERT